MKGFLAAAGVDSILRRCRDRFARMNGRSSRRGEPARVGIGRVVFGLLTALNGAGPVAAIPAAAAEVTAVAFIQSLLRQAVEVLSDGVPRDRREQGFRQLFQTDFDGPWIARLVLGLYWPQASAVEQQQFVALFANYVVFVYAARLADLHGETFSVTGSRADAGTLIVSTDIASPGRPAPLNIDWRLVNDSGTFKVVDVIVGGVSMMVTERSEIASVIRRHGGRVGGALALMRDNLASVASAQ